VLRHPWLLETTPAAWINSTWSFKNNERIFNSHFQFLTPSHLKIDSRLFHCAHEAIETTFEKSWHRSLPPICPCTRNPWTDEDHCIVFASKVANTKEKDSKTFWKNILAPKLALFEYLRDPPTFDYSICWIYIKLNYPPCHSVRANQTQVTFFSFLLQPKKRVTGISNAGLYVNFIGCSSCITVPTPPILRQSLHHLLVDRNDGRCLLCWPTRASFLVSRLSQNNLCKSREYGQRFVTSQLRFRSFGSPFPLLLRRCCLSNPWLHISRHVNADYSLTVLEELTLITAFFFLQGKLLWVK